jgi:uncharacterized protein
MRAPLRLMLLTLVFSAAWPSPSRSEAPSRRITTVGQADVVARPDVAILTVGVITEAEGATAALAQNSGTMANLIENAERAGLESRDIQTSGLSLNPRYVYPQQQSESEKPRLIGYMVSNHVTLRVRDFSRLGPLLDRLVSVGANAIRSIAFDITEKSRVSDDARTRAMEDAKRKALLYAKSAYVSLGPLISLTEENVPTSSDATIARSNGVAQAAPLAAPVEIGEVRLQVRLQATWSITD